MNNLSRLSKKNVAILGGSLPMLLLAYFLNNKDINVKLLDNSDRIGGAWKKFKFKNIDIRKQTNVVVPINKKEETNHLNINMFLKKNFDIKISRIKDKIITPYKSENKFSYNFDHFLKKVPKKKILKKLTVKKIEIIKNGKIRINGKYLFDHVFMPTYFGIDRINTKNKIIKIDNTIIQSEHVVAIIKSDLFNGIYYSDFFNNFFDRVQFIKQSKFFTFSARITKDKKGSNSKIILKELEKIFQKNQILFFKKFKYKNFYRNHNQILKLKKLDKYKSFKYMNTQSLLSFLTQTIKYLR